jgi:starch-binding outer membrane protein, SusD/RagB family
MKRYNKFFLPILLAAMSITACQDDFLNVKPLGVLDQASLQNKVGVNLLLVGAYSMLDGVQTNVGSAFSDWQGSADNWVYGEVTADNAVKGSDSNDQPEISLIESYNTTPALIHFRGKWRAVYDGVARSNDVLQAADKAQDMTAVEKTQAIAQARFLRGHYHFEAKKMWNNVPFVDDKTYNPADPNSTKIPNDKDIWPNIVDDLKFAYENLPATWAGQPGRATKWAAAALLGKAYMFQAKYAEAKPLFEAIVNSKQYDLMPKYHDNFRSETNNNKESILEVEFSINDGAAINNNGNRGGTLNYPYTGSPVTTCCGFYQPTQSLVNAFKTDAVTGLPDANPNATDVNGVNSQTYTGPLDPRLDWTVGRQGIQYLDWGLHLPGYVRDIAYAGPFSPKKSSPYKSDIGKTAASNPRQNANNYRMIRYAHVLLMLAECEVELGTSIDKAREYVNLIRTRAGNAAGFVQTPVTQPNYKIGTYTTAWSDKVAAREAVRLETRLELAMEGHRFFDLVRWKIADKTVNDYITFEQKGRTYLKGAKFTAGKHEYFPIPLAEIINSSIDGKATLTQNPNY